jgi:hypothetical protein
VHALLGMAEIAALRARDQEAGRLLGAADALLPETSKLERFEDNLRRRTLDGLAGRLGQERLDAARAAGAKMTLEEALEIAS